MILQKNEKKLITQTAVAKRRPLTFVCKCGHQDLLGLPRGVGVMEWQCGSCKKRYQLQFAGQGGKTFEKLTELI